MVCDTEKIESIEKEVNFKKFLDAYFYLSVGIEFYYDSMFCV